MFEDFEDVMIADTLSRRRLCGFGKWAATLSEEDRQQAEAMVLGAKFYSNGRAYTCRQLARYFATKGATFNDQVVNRHRNGQCCGQK